MGREARGVSAASQARDISQKFREVLQGLSHVTLQSLHTNSLFDPVLTRTGNIAKDDPNNYPKPEDLVTPTLKSDKYTTGRGGTGNMAKNDTQHPELARAAQDVDSGPQPEPQGPKHYGRGGAANIISDGQPAQRKSAEAKRKGEEARAEDKGLLAKGKDFLTKLGKK